MGHHGLLEGKNDVSMVTMFIPLSRLGFKFRTEMAEFRPQELISRKVPESLFNCDTQLYSGNMIMDEEFETMLHEIVVASFYALSHFVPG
jgi:hypothetical protein